MTQYLAVYTGTPQGREASGWDKLDETTRKARESAGMKAWHDWMDKHKAAIVVQGGPLGKTKHVGKNGIGDIKNHMVGYIVVDAPSHAAAAKMFEDHPHFTIFPGDCVEIMECLAIPGQG